MTPFVPFPASNTKRYAEPRTFLSKVSCTSSSARNSSTVVMFLWNTMRSRSLPMSCMASVTPAKPASVKASVVRHMFTIENAKAMAMSKVHTPANIFVENLNFFSMIPPLSPAAPQWHHEMNTIPIHTL